MRFFTLFALSALSLAVAEPHGFLNPLRHRDIAQRSKGDVQLHKRYDNARWTFYDVGLGACGKTNQPSDFIVALNSGQFGGGFPGPNCFKTITMTYNGKSTQATIMDECPGCPYYGLDLSRGLFNFFAPESVGVLYGTWVFSDGSGSGGGDNTPSPSPTLAKPKPSPTSTPTPTSTYSTESTTPTPTQQKTSTSSTSSTSTTSHTVLKKTSTTSTSVTSTSSSTAAVPTSDSDVQNLDSIYQAIIDLAGIVVAV